MNIILIVIAVLIVIVLFSGIRIVPEAKAMIIERLGKYHKTLPSGFNIIIPFLDSARSVPELRPITDKIGESKVIVANTHYIDLREQVLDYPKQNVITKDNVTVAIDAVIYFQVMDPKSSIYEIVNYPIAIEKLTQTTLRNVIGELELDETLTSRDTINSKLQAILDEATDKWGIKVNRVELQDIIPPEDIRKQMEKQMGAEREKRAAILKAEGEKQSEILKAEGFKQALINRAEGDKQASILRAQGEAKAIEAVKLALDNKEEYTQYLIAMRYIETFKDMASGKDNKMIYMPYETSGVLSSLGGIKDMFVDKNTPIIK
ncbi:MAG: SPFH/Band 7/PHB domain protein [Spirochaetaceae bacterium]|nr:SPFH/Band 7/PHB domain protein [Spirochaetaceae bacterium]